MTVATSTYATNGKAPAYERRLAQSNGALLADASAIDARVITKRGYWTAVGDDDLGPLGFAGNQRHTPALVLPVWDVSGHVAFSQIRPNNPREGERGRAVKYE